MYKRLKKIKKLLPLYIMALPALVYLFINNYLPLTGMVVAFKDFDYSKGIYGSDWAGFRNFLFLFKNSVAFIITRNTILYNVAFIIINTFLGILVAILLSEVTSKKALKSISDSDSFAIFVFYRHYQLSGICFLKYGCRLY